MEILYVGGCPYEDNEGEVLELHVRLDEGEVLTEGGNIRIEMMDDFLEEMNGKVCISPFKEIECGEESIYDYVEEGYSVPDKVIAYLQTKELLTMSLGLYEHPFKPGVNLAGPYWYTDGHYFWDRDTWKYVLKYHVTLPQEFIDHVMSDAGTAFLEAQAGKDDPWAARVREWKEQENTVCFLSEDAEDVGLDDF